VSGMSPAAAVMIDGVGLSCLQVRQVARDGAAVSVQAGGLERARLAREVVARVGATRPVYGRTTGVGANRTVDVFDAGHGLRLLRSHAGGAGPLLDVTRARALLVVRLNQLAAGGSGVDPAVAGVLAEALNLGLTPQVRMIGSIGTGDLAALACVGLCLLGERPWQGGTLPPFRMDPADALAFMSSNAATIGEAALACADLGALASTALCLIGERPWLGGLGETLPPFALDPADALAFMSSNAATIGEAALATADLTELIAATPVVAALSFLVVRGSAEPYSVAVQQARPHRGQAEVAAEMRALLAGQDVQAARIQDPYGYRALPQVHGPAVDAVRALRDVLDVEMNAAAENPLIDAASGQVIHNGNFYTAYLGLALDSARMALFQTAALSTARLGTLVEPAMTGLRPFLASDVPASSGVLALEYVAHSALADIRRLASPATLGTAVLSRGLEEQANFSTQAARAATDTVAAHRIVLACELVAAIRGLRLRQLVPAPGPLRDAYELAAPALDTRIEDRPLDADIDAAEGLLATLAEL